MLLKYNLGQELAKTLDVNHIYHIHLPSHKLSSKLVALEPLHTPLERVFLLAATAAKALRQL